MGYSPHPGQDPEGDYSPGPAMLQDMWTHHGLSPRIHPKSIDSLLELHQAEILEDLNSLGRYSRSVEHDLIYLDSALLTVYSVCPKRICLFAS